jgi:hypothetical protein
MILMNVYFYGRMHHMVWCNYSHSKFFLKIYLHVKDVYEKEMLEEVDY